MDATGAVLIFNNIEQTYSSRPCICCSCNRRA